MARNPVKFCIQAADGKFLKITPETEALPYYDTDSVGPEIQKSPYDYKSRQAAERVFAHIMEYARRNTRSEQDRMRPGVRQDWRYTKYVDSLQGAKIVEIAR